MTPKEHARLLGMLLWVYVAIQMLIVGGFSILYVSILSSVFANVPHRPNEPNPEAFLGIVVGIVIFILFVTALFMIPKVVAGYGLRNGRSWAKVWTIIACCFAVISVPFGTAVGIYGFWFVFGEQGKAYFDGYDSANNFPPSSPPPPPAPNQWQ